MNQFAHGGFVYDREGRQRNVLDFSANINPLGIPSSVRSIILENLDGIRHYPDPEARALKSAIASHYSLDFENIAVFNGAAEFFYVYFNALAPKNIFIPAPSFSEYERSAVSASIGINFFDADDPFSIRNENLIVCNPNNPTGKFFEPEEILSLTVENNVIVDESFIDFVGDERSVKRFVRSKKNLIVVQSLTKIFAIPGLRLGFAVADRAIVERLERAKDVWNVNYFAQLAGVAALDDQDYLERTRRWIEVERRYVFDRLRSIEGLEVFEPTANFILIRFETGELARRAIERLSAKNILVRSCENFRGLDARFIRTAIRLRAENDQLLDELRSTKRA